jgi:hypothetical protein
MRRLRFEPKTPVFMRAKTVGALNRAATVICPSRAMPVEISKAVIYLLHELLHLYVMYNIFL